MIDRSLSSCSSLRHKLPSMRGVPDTAAALASYRELRRTTMWRACALRPCASTR